MALESLSPSASLSSQDSHTRTRSDHPYTEKSLGNYEDLKITPTNGKSPSSHSLTPASSAPSPEIVNVDAMATSTVTGKQWQWDNIKLGLRVADIALSVILLCLASALEFLIRNGVFVSGITPPAATAVLWNVAELVTLVTTKGEKGIVVGAHVGVHVLILLGWIANFILLIITGIMEEYRVANDEEDYDWATRRYPGSFDTLWTLLAFMVLAISTQLFLLIISCREEHLRRREKYRLIKESTEVARAAARESYAGSVDSGSIKRVLQ